ncbi:uncharacterized protein LACBIDRAFT_329787 [Laccaria bicolor S238N-H82]|uniref:Predicted protein n=1 Tax=Laccaria bicolor (strain S238N-H82 / ATCC MYA-4686) TaxID=486041 RepID=B0DJ88_LACBS|nr:uncharacterized protein LACBIDRAFT_329787 [Laccaria bicolor S238N-H82]EDR05478.1 predicted protein [Laccaria bicolor S238N-H82]|eukprot:XP_001884036.1 predicted protein [Laccaria bicolor S238N-H82]
MLPLSTWLEGGNRGGGEEDGWWWEERKCWRWRHWRGVVKGGGGGGGREWDGHGSVTMLQIEDVMIWYALNPLDWDWTQESGWQSSRSPLDWTGLDWTPVDWAFCQPIWPGKRATGIHWNPLESTGVHMDYVEEVWIQVQKHQVLKKQNEIQSGKIVDAELEDSVDPSLKKIKGNIAELTCSTLPSPTCSDQF